MKAFINLALVLQIFCLPLFSQTNTALSNEKTKRVSFAIGKSSDNSLTKNKDAEIIGTFSDTDTLKGSWLTNAFSEVKFVNDSKRISLGILAELHKNTLITKKQDVFQYGISFEKVFSKKDPEGIATTEFPLTVTIKNSNNKVKNEENFMINGGISFHKFTGPSFLRSQTVFPKFDTPIANFISFSHDHNIGFTYLGNTEKVLLGQLDFEFNAYLFSGFSYKWTNKVDLFKFQFTYKGRTELLGNTNLDLNSYLDFQLGLNFALDKKNSFGIAYDWIQGADPLAGLSNQSFRTLTAKIKLTLN